MHMHLLMHMHMHMHMHTHTQARRARRQSGHAQRARRRVGRQPVEPRPTRAVRPGGQAPAESAAEAVREQDPSDARQE